MNTILFAPKSSEWRAEFRFGPEVNGDFHLLHMVHNHAINAVELLKIDGIGFIATLTSTQPRWEFEVSKYRLLRLHLKPPRNPFYKHNKLP